MFVGYKYTFLHKSILKTCLASRFYRTLVKQGRIFTDIKDVKSVDALNEELTHSLAVYT
jgi:hypothetical protein